MEWSGKHFHSFLSHWGEKENVRLLQRQRQMSSRLFFRCSNLFSILSTHWKEKKEIGGEEEKSKFVGQRRWKGKKKCRQETAKWWATFDFLLSEVRAKKNKKEKKRGAKTFRLSVSSSFHSVVTTTTAGQIEVAAASAVATKKKKKMKTINWWRWMKKCKFPHFWGVLVGREKCHRGKKSAKAIWRRETQKSRQVELLLTGWKKKKNEKSEDARDACRWVLCAQVGVVCEGECACVCAGACLCVCVCVCECVCRCGCVCRRACVCVQVSECRCGCVCWWVSRVRVAEKRENVDRRPQRRVSGIKLQKKAKGERNFFLLPLKNHRLKWQNDETAENRVFVKLEEQAFFFWKLLFFQTTGWRNRIANAVNKKKREKSFPPPSTEGIAATTSPPRRQPPLLHQPLLIRHNVTAKMDHKPHTKSIKKRRGVVALQPHHPPFCLPLPLRREKKSSGE